MKTEGESLFDASPDSDLHNPCPKSGGDKLRSRGGGTVAVSGASQRSGRSCSEGKHKSLDGSGDGSCASGSSSACSLFQTPLQSGTKWVKVLITSPSLVSMNLGVLGLSALSPVCQHKQPKHQEVWGGGGPIKHQIRRWRRRAAPALSSRTTFVSSSPPGTADLEPQCQCWSAFPAEIGGI